MVLRAHFKMLSNGLKELWEEEYLTHADIKTIDNPVRLHKVILLIFSTITKENLKVFSSLSSSFASKQVYAFIKFLYDSDEEVSQYFPEIIHELSLNLTLDEAVKKKKNSKEMSKQENINLELKYLRDLTFEHATARLLQNGCLGSDIILRTGKKLHKCHKVILAAVSDYFKVMFVSGMKESEDDEIKLEDVDSHIFSIILQYIYSGNITINTSNVQDLLSTSRYLQIRQLQVSCEEFLINHLDHTNCIDVWKLGKLHDCEDVCDGAWQYIVDNFDGIPKQNLIGLPINEIFTLLKDDSLKAQDEKEILKYALHWISKSGSDDKHATVLHHIRFSFIAKEFIQELLTQHSHIKKCKACSELLKQALDKPNTAEKPRKEKSFLVLKGSASATKLEVTCYSLQQQKWYELQSTKSLCGTGFAVCVSSSGNDLYLTGGSAHPQFCHHFSMDENKWTAKADMNEGRYSHAVGFVNDRIYVLGGFSAYFDSDLDGSIEKYDIHTDTWTVISKLQIPTYDSASTVVKSKIYLFGGTMPVIPGSYVKDIQCFDTVTEACTVVYQNLPMPLSLGVAVACSHNRDIYIVCPRGDIIYYREDTQPTVIKPAGADGCMGFGVVYHDHKLHIMGGSNMSATLSVRYYDLKRNMLETSSVKLPFDKKPHHIFATVANISRQHLVQEFRKINSQRGQSYIPEVPF